jgi:5'-3' exonuclease
MIALIDCDILLYEIGAICEYPKDDPIKNFDYARAAFDGRVEEIIRRSGSEDGILFLSGENNFREKIATVKVYKGNRKQEKPFHYHNLKAYVFGQDRWEVVCEDGLEADDMLAVYSQLISSYGWASAMDSVSDCVICTRDKDLLQVDGYHYRWECGSQPELKTREVWEHPGSIRLVEKLDDEGNVKDRKLVGEGRKFFWSQVLTGDQVDNIPGLPRAGVVFAYNLLEDLVDEREFFLAVKKAYEDYYGEDKGMERLTEQAQLCWMVRELGPLTNEPVLWNEGLVCAT